MRRAAAVLVVVIAAVAVPVHGQRPLVSRQLDSGSVVRLTLGTGRREAVRLVAPFGPDSVLFRYCPYLGPPCVVNGDRRAQRAVTEVVRLDVREGTRARGGALLGAVFGVGAFVAAAGHMYDTPSDWEAAGMVALGAISSAGIGALVGSSLDAWRPALPRSP